MLKRERDERYKARLREVKAEYAKNMEELKKLGPDHMKYIKKERALNSECIDLQKKLRIFIPDPCPLQRSKPCQDCTGRYVYRWVNDHKKEVVEIRLEDKKNGDRIFICTIKKEMDRELE